MGKEECKKCEYCKVYDTFNSPFPTMFKENGKYFKCSYPDMLFHGTAPYGDYTCEKIEVKPKPQNKTCPTCKHGRASNKASLAFDGVPFLCSSPEPVTISHSEHCVTCDGWKKKAVEEKVNGKELCESCINLINNECRLHEVAVEYFGQHMVKCNGYRPVNGLIVTIIGIDLKPCPMCGGKAKMGFHYVGGHRYGVTCGVIGSVYCPGNMNAANNPFEAARLWNKRGE